MSQFSECDGKTTLARYINTPKIYPAGRLDYDSEGLLLLTGDGKLQARIADPRFKLLKRYWVQVEGSVTEEALEQLRQGVPLKDGITIPAQAKKIGIPIIFACAGLVVPSLSGTPCLSCSSASSVTEPST